MNSPKHDRKTSANPAEETLRLLAKASAPDGLAARVQANLRMAPRRRSVFDFAGFSGWMQSTALRTAAATAIVGVVAGGGWQLYSHVQPAISVQGAAVPVRVNPGFNGNGGFATSSAIAKPDPLKAPVITRKLATPHTMPNAVPGGPEKKQTQKKKQAHTPAAARP